MGFLCLFKPRGNELCTWNQWVLSFSLAQGRLPTAPLPSPRGIVAPYTGILAPPFSGNMSGVHGGGTCPPPVLHQQKSRGLHPGWSQDPAAVGVGVAVAALFLHQQWAVGLQPSQTQHPAASGAVAWSCAPHHCGGGSAELCPSTGSTYRSPMLFMMSTKPRAEKVESHPSPYIIQYVYNHKADGLFHKKLHALTYKGKLLNP